MINIKKADSKIDLKNIKKLYKKAFPKCERKPFKTLINFSKNKISDMFCITDEENIFYGLAITIKYKNLVLLDYFAITPEYRNKGIGSKTLAILQNYYKQDILIIEIEDTADSNAKNILQRIKRKYFYIKNNMVLQNFKVNLLGYGMEILTFNGSISFNQYHQIFEQYYPAKIYNKVQLF